MKLTNELKERINKYFADTSAEELFHVATSKYKFSEIFLGIEDVSFNTETPNFYIQTESSFTFISNEGGNEMLMAA